MYKEPINNLLGLKALAWDFDHSVFSSPARPEFVWSPGGLQMCECKLCGNEPKSNCTCGLYATFDWSVAMEYTNSSEISPVCLVEASGITHVYTDGFRSQELTIHGVTPTCDSRVAKMCASQARDYFQVRIIPSPQLLVFFVDVFNASHFDNYIPRSDYVKSLSVSKAKMLSDTLYKELYEN